jgi:hypothetical protein
MQQKTFKSYSPKGAGDNGASRMTSFAGTGPKAAIGGTLLPRNGRLGQAVESGMSKIPWRILKNSHPRAHLVAGAMQPDQPVGDSDLMRAQTGLEHLVRKLEPTGKYATTIVRDVSSSGVHLAFELEGDARRFAAAVNAEVTERYPGWTTQQSFLLSDVTETALSPARPLPITKQPPRNQLKHEVYLLGKMIESNASTLTSKTMNDDDRGALQRLMTTRMAHLKLLRQRLDRLSPALEDRSRRNLR